MQYAGLQKEELLKILSVMKDEYVNLNFSELTGILGSNYAEPTWMDAYVQIYKAKLPPDIKAYDILLEKLSEKLFLMSFEHDNKNYIVKADDIIIREYAYYLISKEKKNFMMILRDMFLLITLAGKPKLTLERLSFLKKEPRYQAFTLIFHFQTAMRAMCSYLKDKI